MTTMDPSGMAGAVATAGPRQKEAGAGAEPGEEAQKRGRCTTARRRAWRSRQHHEQASFQVERPSRRSGTPTWTRAGPAKRVRHRPELPAEDELAVGASADLSRRQLLRGADRRPGHE